MMLPQIELLLGSPVTFPFLPVTFYAQVALGGQIQPPTSSKITVISESGTTIDSPAGRVTPGVASWQI